MATRAAAAGRKRGRSQEAQATAATEDNEGVPSPAKRAKRGQYPARARDSESSASASSESDSESDSESKRTSKPKAKAKAKGKGKAKAKGKAKGKAKSKAKGKEEKKDDDVAASATPIATQSAEPIEEDLPLSVQTTLARELESEVATCKTPEISRKLNATYDSARLYCPYCLWEPSMCTCLFGAQISPALSAAMLLERMCAPPPADAEWLQMLLLAMQTIVTMDRTDEEKQAFVQADLLHSYAEEITQAAEGWQGLETCSRCWAQLVTPELCPVCDRATPGSDDKKSLGVCRTCDLPVAAQPVGCLPKNTCHCDWRWRYDASQLHPSEAATHPFWETGGFGRARQLAMRAGSVMRLLRDMYAAGDGGLLAVFMCLARRARRGAMLATVFVHEMVSQSLERSISASDPRITRTVAYIDMRQYVMDGFYTMALSSAVQSLQGERSDKLVNVDGYMECFKLASAASELNGFEPLSVRMMAQFLKERAGDTVVSVRLELGSGAGSGSGSGSGSGVHVSTETKTTKSRVSTPGRKRVTALSEAEASAALFAAGMETPESKAAVAEFTRGGVESLDLRAARLVHSVFVPLVAKGAVSQDTAVRAVLAVPSTVHVTDDTKDQMEIAARAVARALDAAFAKFAAVAAAGATPAEVKQVPIVVDAAAAAAATPVAVDAGPRVMQPAAVQIAVAEIISASLVDPTAAAATVAATAVSGAYDRVAQAVSLQVHHDDDDEEIGT